MSHSSVLYHPGQEFPGYAKATGLDEATVAVLNAQGERNMLAHAIATTAHTLGIYNNEVALDGPQLLMLCQDMADTYTQPFVLEASAAFQAQVEAPLAPSVESVFQAMPPAAFVNDDGEILSAKQRKALAESGGHADAFAGKLYSADQVQRLIAEAQNRMGGNLVEGLLRVDLPHTVVEILAQHAGLPGPFPHKFHAFAQALKDEIIARLPSEVVRPGRPSHDPLLRVVENLFDGHGQPRAFTHDDQVEAAYALETAHGALPPQLQAWQAEVDVLRESIEVGMIPVPAAAFMFEAERASGKHDADSESFVSNEIFCGDFPGAVQRLLHWTYAWGRWAGLHRLATMDADADHHHTALRRGAVLAAADLQSALTLGASSDKAALAAGTRGLVEAMSFTGRELERMFAVDASLNAEVFRQLQNKSAETRDRMVYGMGFARAQSEVRAKLDAAVEDLSIAAAHETAKRVAAKPAGLHTLAGLDRDVRMLSEIRPGAVSAETAASDPEVLPVFHGIDELIPQTARAALAAGERVGVAEMGPEFQQALRKALDSGLVHITGAAGQAETPNAGGDTRAQRPSIH